MNGSQKSSRDSSLAASSDLVTFWKEEVRSRLRVGMIYSNIKFARREGYYWRSQCPLHGGDDVNFSVHTQTLRWRCFSHCGIGSQLLLFGLDPALPAARRASFLLVVLVVEDLFVALLRQARGLPYVAAIGGGQEIVTARLQKLAVLGFDHITILLALLHEWVCDEKGRCCGSEGSNLNV